MSHVLLLRYFLIRNCSVTGIVTLGYTIQNKLQLKVGHPYDGNNERNFSFLVHGIVSSSSLVEEIRKSYLKQLLNETEYYVSVFIYFFVYWASHTCPGTILGTKNIMMNKTSSFLSLSLHSNKAYIFKSAL